MYFSSSVQEGIQTCYLHILLYICLFAFILIQKPVTVSLKCTCCYANHSHRLALRCFLCIVVQPTIWLPPL